MDYERRDNIYLVSAYTVTHTLGGKYMKKYFWTHAIVLALFITFMPVANAEEKSEVVVEVMDYGADHSGKNDSTQAIIDALDQVKKYNGEQDVRLVFEPGTYKITKENSQVREVHTSNTDSVRFPNKHIGILIEDIDNLTLDGQGAQLIFEGDMMALAIMQSENIKIENLSWDFQIPTTSELTVFDFDNDKKTVDYFVPSYFNYEIDGVNMIWQSEKDSKDKFYWTEKNAHRNYGIQIKYPTEMMGRSYHSHLNPYAGVTNIEKLDNGLLRFTYQSGSPVDPVKGMNYQLVSNSIRPTAGAFVFESKDVYFDNVKISYMHGFGFLVQMAENVFFNKIKMETDIETGKNTSSYADGIHVSGAKGRIEITNSFFSNTHDDPINIHGTFTRAEEIIDSKTLRLNYIHAQQGGFQQFHPGDKVIFYSRDTLESMDEEKEYTVKSVKGPDKSNLKSMIVEFEEEVPKYVTEKIGNEPKYVAENITYTPEVLIKNNDFKNVFTRMILVTSRKKVIIEDNRFDAPSMPTLFFSNDSDEWYESGPIRDLEIRNNTFKIRTLGRTWWKYAPAIYFHPVTKGAGFPDADNPIHKNILIEDNTFYLESDGALRAESVENLTFRNNKILRLDPNIELELSVDNKMSLKSRKQISLTSNGSTVEGLKSLPGGPEHNSGSVANVLEFQNSKNVLVEGNTYDQGLKTNILIEGMDADKYTVNDPLTILTERQNNPADNPVGKVTYVSTNPEVASIDENGLITSYNEGVTDIYAYTVWNETIIKSNVETITVEAVDSKENLELETYVYELSSDDAELTIKDINGDLVDLKDFEISVSDSSIFKIENQTVEILKSGISKVSLFNDKKETEFFIVANYTPEHKVLNSKINIEDKDQSSEVHADQISITRQGGQDLWGGDNNLSNLIKISLEDYDVDNFSAQVTLEGLPLRAASGSWDSSYFLLMRESGNKADRDNYLSVGKRAHAEGIGMVKEVNGRGNESNDDLGLELNNVTSMTLVIEKQGDNVTLYYKNGEIYTEIEQFDVSYLGKSLTLAVAGWGDTQTNRTLTVRNIKITEGNHEQLAAAEELDILVSDDTNIMINDFTVKQLSNNRFQVESDNKQNTNVFIEDGNGKTTFFPSDSFHIYESGTYKIHALNRSDSGKYSSVRKKLVEIDPAVEKVTKLNNQAITEDMTLDIPKNLTNLQIQKDGQEIKSVDISGVDKLTVDGFTVKLNKIGSNKATIKKINTNHGDINLNESHSFIRTDSIENILEMSIETEGVVSKIVVDNEDHDIDYEVSEDNTVKIPIHNGVVSVRVRVYAEDESTFDVHTIHVMRNYQLTLNKVTVSLDNKELTEGIIDFEYKYTLEDLVVEAPRNTKTSIHSYGEDIIIIRVEHEDKRTVEFFEYHGENFKNLNLKKEALQEKVDEARLYAEDDYTPQSYAFLKTAIEEANLVLGTATTQDQIDSAFDTLSEAIKNLESIESLDYQALTELIESGEKLSKDTYTIESYEALQAAIKDAKAVLGKATTQKELDTSFIVLSRAFENLESVVSLDVDVLEALIESARKLSKEVYTTESFKALTEAIEEAKLVLVNARTQVEVDSSVKALGDAIEKLEIIVELSTDSLRTLIEESKAIKENDHTEKSYKALKKSIQVAENVLNTATKQSEIDKAFADLTKTLQKLEVQKIIKTPVTKLPVTGAANYLIVGAMVFIILGVLIVIPKNKKRY